MIQQKSQTFKYGEPLDHMMAVEKVFDFLRRNQEKYFIDVAIPITYPPQIIKQLPKTRTHNGHTFDLGIYETVKDELGVVVDLKILAYIEINGNVGYKYIDGAGRTQKANPTKHSKALQKRNDKINKNYCELKGIIYKVLLKEEINGDIKDKDKEKNTIQYMQRELLEFIK